MYSSGCTGSWSRTWGLGAGKEFDLSGGLPRLLYVKGPAPDREPRLADLLDRISDEDSASCRHFRAPAELDRLVRDDLAVLLSDESERHRCPGTK
jgi:hypothetical protein